MRIESNAMWALETQARANRFWHGSFRGTREPYGVVRERPETAIEFEELRECLREDPD